MSVRITHNGDFRPAQSGLVRSHRRVPDRCHSVPWPLSRVQFVTESRIPTPQRSSNDNAVLLPRKSGRIISIGWPRSTSANPP